MRAAVLELVANERYADFGPTLLAEHLARRHLQVDHETVRRWLLAAGHWTVRRRQSEQEARIPGAKRRLANGNQGHVIS